MDKNIFKCPNQINKYSLSPFWFWNDYIQNEGITNQMEMMHNANINQPVIHARHGLEIEYMSEEWFDKIGFALDEAKRLGMSIWLYDENNWPSGNCNGEVTIDIENREHFLLIQTVDLQPGEKLLIPKDDECIEKSEIINATLYTGDQSDGDDLLKDFKPENLSEFVAENKSTVYLVKLAVNIYNPFGRLAVDYMSKDAIRCFINKTHDKYKQHFESYFANTIYGIFMDETRFLNALPWTKNFAETFKIRKGYDIIPLLHLLVKNEKSSKYVRYDYFDTVAYLLQEATFKQIFDWCNENNIKSIGHILGEETIASQSRFNADCMRLYRYMHIPGIDHLGNGTGSLDAKMCSSAAHNYGKLTVASESFGACGWDMEYEDLIKISNWEFQQGINHILIHAFYYSIRDERKNDWPPSYFHHWKYWNKMPEYAQMASRMSYTYQDSVNETELLVYYPVESFWVNVEPDFKTQTCYFKDGPETRNSDAAEIDYDFQFLCSSLLNENFDFEVFNSDAADYFEVVLGKLQHKVTGARYSTIILPHTNLLPGETANLLNEFVSQGGKIITYKCNEIEVVGQRGEHLTIPSSLPVLKASEFLNTQDIEDVILKCRKHVSRPFSIIEGTRTLTRTQMTYPSRLHDPYLHEGEQQFGIGVTSHIKGNDRIINFTNYNMSDEPITVEVRTTAIPEMYVPESGNVISFNDIMPSENGYILSFTIPANRAILIVGKV